MPEQLFEVVRFDEARLLRYSGASHPEDRSLRADLFLSFDIFGDYEGGYAQIVPRMRPTWPTPQEFADETLADILGIGWRNIPIEDRNSLVGSRVAILSAHGNTFVDSDKDNPVADDWYARLEGDLVIPIPELLEKHLSNYEVVVLGVCNPGRREPAPSRGTLYFPSYMFSFSDETEMVTRTPSSNK